MAAILCVPRGQVTRKTLNGHRRKEMSMLHEHETHDGMPEPMKQETPATTEKDPVAREEHQALRFPR